MVKSVKKKEATIKLSYGTKKEWVIGEPFEAELVDGPAILVHCNDGTKEYVTKNSYVGVNMLDPYRMYDKKLIIKLKEKS